ncbi:hypothetical protein BHE90_011492 [Fusarium euwallaceae]|uniref:Uncharacterized protein n=1 Tax=Fusarium euwallaceae TaxID=1147111 RepID=A0A430LEH3_9HYPO|nr:hypothetical protein BHE90_011492 [Fusarium euwallaceae]
MTETCTYNCSAHPTAISAYGDISGIGVVAAFFITAWIVVLLLIGYYLVVFNPELDPFRQPGERTPCQYPNVIDYAFLYAVRQLPGLRSLQYSERLRSSQLESALNKCVITAADIQIFTGLAVMISGYIALHCGLQSYHWQLTVHLVWLASLTHLAALSFLRNHFANRPGPRTWRVIAMSIMLVFLAVAVGLAGYFDWGDEGANKASDFAVCYFGKKMDTRSVAFESMIKTLILLVYGFFIRLAKMSRAFEGSLRAFPAHLSARAMRLQRGNDRDTQQWDPRTLTNSIKSFIQGVRSSLRMAGLSFVSIHVNLLTSFLAEVMVPTYVAFAFLTLFTTQVYWLTLSALWVTRRYFKTRVLGPKEEDEWTFGQVLPLLLVVAPLAAILEQFIPAQALTDRRRQRPSQTALLILNQLERDEAEDNNIPVEIDLQYIHSLAYRGAFLLAAIAYIEVGIFFVVDQLPGITKPLLRIGFVFFATNPLLQLLWIHCALWIPYLTHSNVIRRTVRGVVLSMLAAITVNEFLLGAMILIEEEEGDLPTSPIIGYLSFVAPGFGLVFSLLTMWYIGIVRDSRKFTFNWRFIALLLLALSTVTTFILLSQASPAGFMCNLGVCICVELVWYILELLMERRSTAPKRAVFLRCGLLLFIFSALGVSYAFGPITDVFASSAMVSAGLWILVGTIASLVRSRQTRGESATSNT